MRLGAPSDPADWVVRAAQLKRIVKRPRAEDPATVFVDERDLHFDSPGLQSRICVGSDVLKAVEQMRLANPMSLHDAIEAERRRVTKLDPRFDIAIYAGHDGQPSIRLHPKELVTISLTPIRKDARKKLEDLLAFGDSVEFAPGELRITGSKLFEAIEFHGGIISQSIHAEGAIQIICRDENKSELGRLTELHGAYEGGRSSWVFKGSLAAPLFGITVGSIEGTAGGATQCSFKMNCWDGILIRHLPYFDQIHNFLIAAAKAHHSELLCYFQGNQVFSADTVGTVALPPPLLDLLTVIWKARRLCERYDINPVWSLKTVTADDMDTVAKLYSVVDGRALGRTCGCTSISQNGRSPLPTHFQCPLIFASFRYTHTNFSESRSMLGGSRIRFHTRELTL